MSTQPYSYYGGKATLASRIVAMMPPHAVYTEVFAGGASVFWRKPVPPVTNNDHYREVLNDSLGLIVHLMRTMRDQPDELQRRAQLMPYSRAEYERGKALWRGEVEIEDDVERAALVWLLLNASFGGQPGNGWSLSASSRQNAHTHTRKVDSLPRFARRLRGVFVEQGDALEMLRRWDCAHALHYVDPPYVGTNQGHYGGWTHDHHLALLSTLGDLQGAFMLSGYADPMTDEYARARGWQRVEWETRSSANNTGTARDAKRTEVLWYRWRTAEPEGVAADYYQAPIMRTFTGRWGEGVDMNGQMDLFG